MAFRYRLPKNFRLQPIKTEKERKARIRELDGILRSNEEALSRIDGLVSFGLAVSRNCWTDFCMYFRMTNKFTSEQHDDIVQMIALLPGMTPENVQFEIEPVPKGKHTAFGGERIRPVKPRRWDGS